MEPGPLLDLFGEVSAAVAGALDPIGGVERRARTDRPGQYAIDVVADAAALRLLHAHDLAVVSEESGVSGNRDAAVTVVLDPVDGSTNASRHLPYWATSLCALDADGPLAAMVVNHATGRVTTAVRGGGAFRDGVALRASTTERVEDSMVAVGTLPARVPPWKQFRAMGSCALALCDVAAGAFDGYFDAGSVHAPWDYLGGLLACTEAGAEVIDGQGRPLAVTDPDARRHLVAAGTPALLQVLESVAT